MSFFQSIVNKINKKENLINIVEVDELIRLERIVILIQDIMKDIKDCSLYLRSNYEEILNIKNKYSYEIKVNLSSSSIKEYMLDDENIDKYKIKFNTLINLINQEELSILSDFLKHSYFQSDNNRFFELIINNVEIINNFYENKRDKSYMSVIYPNIKNINISDENKIIYFENLKNHLKTYESNVFENVNSKMVNSYLHLDNISNNDIIIFKDLISELSLLELKQKSLYFTNNCKTELKMVIEKKYLDTHLETLDNVEKEKVIVNEVSDLNKQDKKKVNKI